MRSFKELIEAKKPSDDNFGGAGYSGERGFKNKATASRGGQTAGRNRSDAARRKAQQGMIDAALKQDKKEFRKHAVAMSKSMSSMTRRPHPIQNMWTKEKAKALKDGTWFKMSIAQQKKIEGDKPRFEPFDWSKMEEVSEAVSPAQQAAIAISKKQKIRETIRHEGDKWVIYSKDGSKKLGEYDTEKAAKKRLRQIEFFKHQNESVLKSVRESLHIKNNLIEQNIFRVGSEGYFEFFNQMRDLYESGELEVKGFDKELMEGDLGLFAEFEGEIIPLDCPMLEEEKDVELNKPKAGGPKKYYVYVKDPSTGNVKKVTWGDTTGLKVKLNDKEARKSFAARHKCAQQKDRTSAAYWACNLPRYAKQLGLSGGGNFYW